MRNAARVWASLRGVQDDMLDVDISVDHLLYNVGDSTLLCRDHVSPALPPTLAGLTCTRQVRSRHAPPSQARARRRCAVTMQDVSIDASLRFT